MNISNLHICGCIYCKISENNKIDLERYKLTMKNKKYYEKLKQNTNRFICPTCLKEVANRKQSIKQHNNTIFHKKMKKEKNNIADIEYSEPKTKNNKINIVLEPDIQEHEGLINNNENIKTNINLINNNLEVIEPIKQIKEVIENINPIKPIDNESTPKGQEKELIEDNKQNKELIEDINPINEVIEDINPINEVIEDIKQTEPINNESTPKGQGKELIEDNKQNKELIEDINPINEVIEDIKQTEPINNESTPKGQEKELKLDLKTERVDLKTERVDLKTERADLKTEKPINSNILQGENLFIFLTKQFFNNKKINGFEPNEILQSPEFQKFKKNISNLYLALKNRDGLKVDITKDILGQIIDHHIRNDGNDRDIKDMIEKLKKDFQNSKIKRMSCATDFIFR